jgi:hypothetical protein
MRQAGCGGLVMVAKTAEKRTDGWKKLGGDFAPSIFLNAGESVEGTLKEKREIKDNEGKLRKVYTLDTGDKGFKDKDGNKLTGEATLWGAGLLDHLLKSVTEGSEIMVVFKGKEKVQIGNKKVACNQHEVFVK